MAAAFAGGIAIHLVLNLVFALLAFSTVDILRSETIGFIGAAAVLALLMIGGGALCIIKGTRVVKSLGMGMIFGWSAMSIVSLGYCTGLNPALYSGF